MLTRRLGRLLVPLIKGSDAAAALLAWLIAPLVYQALYPSPSNGQATVTFRAILPPLVLSLALLVPVFEQFGLYEPKRMERIAPEMWSLASAILVVWAMTYLAVEFILMMDLSSRFIGLMLIAWLAVGIGGRLTARGMLRWFRRRGWNLRRAAIVGTGRLAQRTLHVLRKNMWMGIEPLYFVEDQAIPRTLLGLDVVGPIDALAGTVAARPVDIVFVALSGQAREKTDQVLEQLASTSADVRLVPDLLSLHFLRHEVTLVDDLPIITLTHSPMHGWSSLLKRAFDLVLATVALVVTLLPMLVIALAVKLTSRGPVFYRQQRASLAATPFTLIKFRTMVPNAEAGIGPVWTVRGDLRVTRVGRFLRYTSLDELPQLLNVIKGDMSLVGPRPERPELIERFRQTVPRYMLRHQVKAGLTGWAQVHGLRGPTSLRKRIQYDVYYIANWTFGLDLRILMMTVFGAVINRHER